MLLFLCVRLSVCMCACMSVFLCVKAVQGELEHQWQLKLEQQCWCFCVCLCVCLYVCVYVCVQRLLGGSYNIRGGVLSDTVDACVSVCLCVCVCLSVSLCLCACMSIFPFVKAVQHELEHRWQLEWERQCWFFCVDCLHVCSYMFVCMSVRKGCSERVRTSEAIRVGATAAWSADVRDAERTQSRWQTSTGDWPAPTRTRYRCMPLSSHCLYSSSSQMLVVGFAAVYGQLPICQLADRKSQLIDETTRTLRP